MRDKKLVALVVVWAISIVLLGATRSTYLVEKAMEVFNFEFSSKESYVLAVDVTGWVRVLYFGALTYLSFYLFQRQRRFQ